VSHRVLKVSTIDGSSVGHAVISPYVAEQLLSGAGTWQVIVPGVLPDPGNPMALITCQLRVECLTRCQLTPADFGPADRLQFELSEEASGRCRTYWLDGHRCQLPRGHGHDHRCVSEDCPEQVDPQTYGPDVVYAFERGEL
jgi:hypothetical protein